MNDELREAIRTTIVSSITSFFEGKKVKTKQVLDMIFPVQRRIRSLIGGLETSFGTTVWEPIAKDIAQYYGFTVIDENILEPKPFPEELSALINELKLLREHKGPSISMEYCKSRLIKLCKGSKFDISEFVEPPAGKGVDVYLQKDDHEYVFDIKTVQPNVGDGQRYNEQLIRWYAYRYAANPNIMIDAYIAFPYNPHTKDFWEKTKNKIYPLAPGKDALVADEFWGFLSEGNVKTEDIWSIFQELGENNFGDQFKEVFYKIEK